MNDVVHEKTVITKILESSQFTCWEEEIQATRGLFRAMHNASLDVQVDYFSCVANPEHCNARVFPVFIGNQDRCDA